VTVRAPLLLRVLLRLYPASFRREYEREMTRVFFDRRRDVQGAGVIGLWLSTIADALVSAAHTHMDVLRA
jgi:hypothetical protein